MLKFIPVLAILVLGVTSLPPCTYEDFNDEIDEYLRCSSARRLDGTGAQIFRDGMSGAIRRLRTIRQESDGAGSKYENQLLTMIESQKDNIM